MWTIWLGLLRRLGHSSRQRYCGRDLIFTSVLRTTFAPGGKSSPCSVEYSEYGTSTILQHHNSVTHGACKVLRGYGTVASYNLLSPSRPKNTCFIFRVGAAVATLDHERDAPRTARERDHLRYLLVAEASCRRQKRNRKRARMYRKRQANVSSFCTQTYPRPVQTLSDGAVHQYRTGLRTTIGQRRVNSVAGRWHRWSKTHTS